MVQKGYNSNIVGTENNYQTYQGQEINKELGLNWLSFKYRNYDPAIGRFMSIDPLTEEYVDWGPYVFSGNRVIDARELEGLEPKKVKDLWNSAVNLYKSTDIKSISLGLSFGFKISNSGATGSVSEFEYNIQDNTFSYSALNGFLGIGDSENAVTGEVDVAYSSKNFDNEESEGGFLRGKGTIIKDGDKDTGEVAVFAKNKDGDRGVILTETNKETDDGKRTYAEPETNNKLKFGIGIDLSIDWDKFNRLEYNSKSKQ